MNQNKNYNNDNNDNKNNYNNNDDIYKTNQKSFIWKHSIISCLVSSALLASKLILKSGD